MKKILQKLLAVVLTTYLCTSSLCLQALAGNTTSISGSGTAADPEVKTTVSWDIPILDPSTGEVSKTLHIHRRWSGTTTAGTRKSDDTITVTGESHRQETTVSKDDQQIRSSGSENGHEETVTAHTDTASAEGSDENPLEFWQQGEEKHFSQKSEWTTSSPVRKTDNRTENIALKYGENGYQEIRFDLHPGEEKRETQYIDPEFLRQLLSETNDEKADVSITPIYAEQPSPNGELILIGYQKTTRSYADKGQTSTGPAQTTGALQPKEDTGEHLEEIRSVETIFTLPKGYEDIAIGVPSRSTVDGYTTTTIVENIYGSGEESDTVIGYRTTTTVTDPSGREISSQSDSCFGSKTTITTVVSPDPESRSEQYIQQVTNTVQTTYTRGVTESGETIVASPREVQAGMTEVIAGNGNGEIMEMKTLDPILKNDKKDHSADGGNNLYYRPNAVDGTGSAFLPVDFEEFPFQWLGEYGIESTIRVKADYQKEDGSIGTVSTWQPHQFVLRDAQGNPYYVYCADFDVSPQGTWRYQMTNVENADYYSPEEAKHIRAIASNGFWGTGGDETGSLEAVKQLLRDAGPEKTGLSEAEINALTAGQALTATQAALWRYGNSGSVKLKDDSAIVGAYYNGSGFDYNYQDPAVQKLYEYLLTLTEDPRPETTVIDQNSVVGASITVKEHSGSKEVLENGEMVNKDIYNTDICFALKVEPSQTSGTDLLLSVLDAEGNTLRTVRIAGENQSDDIYETIAGNNGEYMIRDLPLTEGTNITLNLSGTQNLPTGVYLFSAETREGLGSQTFVGVAAGKRKVNLNVGLHFSVTEPTVEKTSSLEEYEQEQTELHGSVREDTLTRITGNVTITTTSESKTQHAWEKTWVSYPSEEPPSPGGDTPEEGEKETPEEPPAEPTPTPPAEQVPSVPKTGDFSILWYILSLFSGITLIILTCLKRKIGKES